MSKPKWKDQMGKYFLHNTLLEIHLVIDSCWSTYVIVVSLSQMKYHKRYKKNEVFPNSAYTEMAVALTNVPPGDPS